MTGPSMNDERYIALSALQHVVFCERQAALIHVEKAWEEDGATARGKVVHERTDFPGIDHRHGIRVIRSLRLVHHELKLTGIADMVEARPDGNYIPVEIKSGAKVNRVADDVQVCAQAFCLEEMFGQDILAGAVFYAKSKRRRTVALDEELRGRTLNAITRMHAIFAAATLPKALFDEKKCKKCSLAHLCVPEAMARNTNRYLEELLK